MNKIIIRRLQMSHEKVNEDTLHVNSDNRALKIQRVRAHEYLGHSVAYDALRGKGNIDVSSQELNNEDEEFVAVGDCTAMLPDQAGNTSNYTLKRMPTINLDNTAVLPTIAFPSNPQPGKQTLIVTFRGTADIDGLNADLFEAGGAGCKSFAENKHILLKTLNDAVKKASAFGEVELVIAGHSLGGALTEQFMALTVDAQAQNYGLTSTDPIPAEYREGLKSLVKVSTGTQNLAGVDETTYKRWIQTLTFLKEQRELNKSNSALGTPMTVELNYHPLVGGDAVQQTGERHLGDSITPDLAAVNVAYIPTALEGKQIFNFYTGAAAVVLGGIYGVAALTSSFLLGGYCTAKAHTSKFFTDPAKPYTGPIEFYDNSTPEGQKKIAELLSTSQKLSMFQHGVLNAGKGLMNAASKVVDVVKNTTSSVTNSISSTFQRLWGSKQESPIVVNPVVAVPAAQPAKAALQVPVIQDVQHKGEPPSAPSTGSSYLPSWSNAKQPALVAAKVEPVVATASTRKSYWPFY